jgi:hypothetical protein
LLSEAEGLLAQTPVSPQQQALLAEILRRSALLQPAADEVGLAAIRQHKPLLPADLAADLAVMAGQAAQGRRDRAMLVEVLVVPIHRQGAAAQAVQVALEPPDLD